MEKSSVNIAFYRKVDRFQAGKFRLVSQQTFCLFDAEHPAAGNVAVGMLAFFRAALVGAPLRPGQETNLGLAAEIFVHMLRKAVQRDMVRAFRVKGFAQRPVSVNDGLIKYLRHVAAVDMVENLLPEVREQRR